MLYEIDVLPNQDNCVYIYNPNQADTDAGEADRVGDACGTKFKLSLNTIHHNFHVRQLP